MAPRTNRCQSVRRHEVGLPILLGSSFLPWSRSRDKEMGRKMAEGDQRRAEEGLRILPPLGRRWVGRSVRASRTRDPTGDAERARAGPVRRAEGPASHLPLLPLPSLRFPARNSPSGPSLKRFVPRRPRALPAEGRGP